MKVLKYKGALYISSGSLQEDKKKWRRDVLKQYPTAVIKQTLDSSKDWTAFVTLDPGKKYVVKGEDMKSYLRVQVGYINGYIGIGTVLSKANFEKAKSKVLKKFDRLYQRFVARVAAKKLTTREDREKAIAEYTKLSAERDKIIRENASRRMRAKRQPPLPVPPKPEPIMIPFAFEQDGTYAGILDSPDDLPNGMVLRWKAHNESWKD